MFLRTASIKTTVSLTHTQFVLQARSLCLTRARRRLATMAILNSAWLVHDRINDFETGDGLRRHRRRSDQEDAAYERFYARGDDYFHGARGG